MSSDSQERSFAPPDARFAHAWRALRHRNFRLFFGGQSISLIGTWMTRVATSWLVYRLTKSAILLGTVGFAGQIPTFLLAPFAGVVVDRLDRRKVLVWTQTLAMVQSLALAALTLSHRITVTEILILSAFQGTINAFDMPGRQSFMIRMVENRSDLSNAIAINSSMVNAARLIGPSLAGIVIAATNEGWCFFIDGVSYIAVIVSLLMMRLSREEIHHHGATMVEQLRQGWVYVSGSLPIRNILMLFCVISLMGWPFMVLMPIFAAQILHGGPHTLGFLMGAVGVGSLASALRLVFRRTVRGLLKIIPIGAAVFGTGAHRVRILAPHVAVAADDACHRIWHDAGADHQQHHPANARRRKAARARDELLRHGLCGHGAIRQPAGRSHGPRDRRSAHRHDQRSCMHRWFAVVLVAHERDSPRDEAHLRAAGHRAGPAGSH